MAQERLEIIISAETDAAAKQITDFGKNLKGLESQANAASSGVTKFNKTVANANPTLVNFGRVLQDAPFGIIGIANNIDPLVSSFQSLKTQTGSASGAFKALGATLLGPAGIAVGISAATSALIAFGPQIADAISGVSSFERSVIEAGNKGAEAFAQAQFKISGLVSTLNDANASATQKKRAFDSLNSALGEYGLQVDSISISEAQASEIGLKYANIKQLEARSTALASKAAEIYVQSLTAQRFVTEEVTQLTGGFVDQLIFFTKNAASGFTAIGKATNSIDKSQKTQKAYTDEINKTNAEIQKELKSLEDLDTVSAKSVTTKNKLIETKKREAEAVKEQVNVLNEIANAAPLVSDPIGSIAQLNQEIAALRKQQQSTFDPVVFANYQKEIDAIAAKIKTIQGGGALPPVEGDAGGTGLGFLNNAFAQTELIAKATAFQEVMGAIKKNADELVASGVDVVLGSVFNSLQNGDNVFEGLGQAVKGFVLQLIKAVAQALILNAILKAFNLGAPGAGSILSGLLGGRGGVGGNRAGGGMVLAGQAYTVGEFGAERFVPSTNGMIVPNDMGGGGGTLTATVSGNDLLFILNQATSNRKNNFG